MANSQLTLFELETQPGMACNKPTKKYPNGRTGTGPGVVAHYQVKEKPCEECAAFNRNRVKSYYASNKKKILEKKRERYQEDPAKYLEYNRAHPQKDPHQASIVRDKWKLKNAEKVRKYALKYARANPEIHTENERRRRARKRSLAAEKYTVEDVTRTYGTVCYLCNTEIDIHLPYGSPLSPEIDHVYPLSRPGCPGDILSNAKLTHSVCNRAKGAKLVSELTLPFISPLESPASLPDHQDQPR